MEAAMAEYAVELLKLLKLLSHLAAVDGRITPEEIDQIIGAGRKAGVDALHLETLRDALERGDAGDDPDVSVLRQDPERTRHLAAQLIAADGVFAEAEERAWAKLNELLDKDS